MTIAGDLTLLYGLVCVLLFLLIIFLIVKISCMCVRAPAQENR